MNSPEPNPGRETAMPPRHGGPRPGAGRPPGPNPQAAHRTRRMVMLSDAEWEQARRLGDGTASAGVRRALALAMAARG